MNSNEQILRLIEEAEAVFMANEDGSWSTYRDGLKVDVEHIEAGVVRMTAHTDVYPEEAVRLAAIATLRYFTGFLLKVGELRVDEAGEVVCVLEGAATDEKAFEKLMSSVVFGAKDGAAAATRVSEGASPREVAQAKIASTFASLMRFRSED